MDSHPQEHITIEQLIERLIVSRSTESTDSLEIITLEEFARRMQVGETTVWKWIRTGKLKPGRHFIQFERVIRFHWCRDLLDRLHEDSSQGEETTEVNQQQLEATAKGTRQTRHYGKRINFEI